MVAPAHLARSFNLLTPRRLMQPLHMLWTVNAPTSRVTIALNREYPSLFFHKSFQMRGE